MFKMSVDTGDETKLTLSGLVCLPSLILGAVLGYVFGEDLQVQIY